MGTAMTAAGFGAVCNISIGYFAEVLAFCRGCFDSCRAARTPTMIKVRRPA